MYVMKTQRSGSTIRRAPPSPSPSPSRSRSRSQNKTKSNHSVSFQEQNQISNNELLESKENIAEDSNSLQPIISEFEDNTKPKSRPSLTQILINKIDSNASAQKIKRRLSSITSLISAKKSTSSTSGFQTKNEEQPTAATPDPVTNQDIEENVSTTSSQRKSRAPRPPRTPSPPALAPVRTASTSSLQHTPKRVESTTSLRKRKSLKKRIKPKQIILSMFRQPEKNNDKPVKPTIKTNVTPTPKKTGKEAKITIKENEKQVKENEKHVKENKEHATTSEKNAVPKTESQHKLKSFSSTRVIEGKSDKSDKPGKSDKSGKSGKPASARTVHYQSEKKNFFETQFKKLKKQFMDYLLGDRATSSKDPNRRHGFLNYFKKTGRIKNDKEKYPSPLTDQIRAHAFRKTVFNIVARLTKKEKDLHQKIKSLAPAPYPRVHGFSQPVLAMFKCGRLREKEEEIEKQTKKIKKKSKTKTTVETSPSKITTVQSTETTNTTETKVVTKSVKKSKKKTNADDDDSDDDDSDELTDGTKITEIITTTTVKTKTESEPNCPYVIDTKIGKVREKRCCCQFLKSLPPTPRETFRKNPGFPHYYPAPGYRHRWGYEMKVRRLERLEEERQRLCAEQRGLPYNGPPRQYQDFFEDTPVEERCCCDDHKKGKKKGSDPNSFQCNKADPHLYPTVTAFKHYFVNKLFLKEKDKELAELRKQCEEAFPEIKPLTAEKKKKLCDCRGAILSAEQDREDRIKEIAEKMAALCTCLDDCDCKAALQQKEPDINLDDERDACCCSRKRPMDEDFDCNAGDPHRQPTVAAFLHGFEYGRRKRKRIAKRKSIYDEIVQHGTEEEVKEARISLLKQIAEDGTKEEQEEARASLEIEETQVVVETEVKRVKEDCTCPEIQEIVVMIEDSDCEEEPMYSAYEICEYEAMSDPATDYMMSPHIQEYHEGMEGWPTDPYVEQPEEVQPYEAYEAEPIELLGAKTLETQTPSGEHLLTQDPRQTTETQTPRTSHTQTENTLQTQTPSTKKSTGSIDKEHVLDAKKSQTELQPKKSQTELQPQKSTEDIKTKEDATSVKSEDSASKKNKFKLKKDTNTKDEATSVMSEDSTSKKNKTAFKDKLFKGLKDITAKKSKDALSTHSDEEKTKTATEKDKDKTADVEHEISADGKKRKKKSSSKCAEKARKLSKADQFMYRSFQPPKCVIKPRCVCLAERKAKLQKERECAKPTNRAKSTQRKCECCCNCKETEKPMRNEKPQRASQEKRASDGISENDETETVEEPQKCNCNCTCVGKQVEKAAPEKPKRKSKCSDNQTKCECVLKSLRQPKAYSLQEGKCKRKSRRSSVSKADENTNTETWVPEPEPDIYYPPPEPPKPEYPNFCQPGNCLYYDNSAGMPPKTFFNFPPPNFSSIYQEYPQSDDMIFSVQFEQDRSSCEYVPIGMQNFNPLPMQESQTSFRIVFTDEDQACCSEIPSESSSSLSTEDTRDECLPCRCKKQAERIPCRCKKPTEKVPCRCNNRAEKIPCRC